MANKKMTKCLSSLAIREMQIKTSLNSILPKSEWLLSKEKEEQQKQTGCEEKGTLTLCWQACKLVQPLR
jgi:hypothetical protein